MTLKEYEDKINGLKAERDSERAELEQAVEAAEKAQREALAQATAAYTAASVTTYHEAQEAARTAGDAAKMYRDKLETINRTPMVTENEYAVMKREGFDLASEAIEVERDNIKSLIDQMGECTERAKKKIEKVNELLQTLQHDLALDDACMVLANGKHIHMEHLELRWRDYSLFEYVRAQKEHPVYTREAKKK